ncbi:MAG: LysM peptidoglycan-binding domain-containing protein [Dehalococcoidia bacterium]|nr:MAG: LysM peptidoglycan-binding domain-containing protein [Dehalococcoidia bacterium]
MMVFKRLLLPALLAALIVLTLACGDEETASTAGAQVLTDPDTVATATPWAEPPPVVYVEGGPGGPTGPAAGTYTVQAGDTLYDIALRFEVSLEELMEANDITDPATLSVGQTLVIPGQESDVVPEGTATPEGEAATPTVSAEGVYIVQEGDYPGSIAEQFGISAEELMEANGITDPTSLVVGQELIIPTPAPSP